MLQVVNVHFQTDWLAQRKLDVTGIYSKISQHVPLAQWHPRLQGFSHSIIIPTWALQDPTGFEKSTWMGLKKINIPQLSSFLKKTLEHQLGAKNSTLEIPMTLLMHEFSHSFHCFLVKNMSRR
jgi:hypothetical protein